MCCPCIFFSGLIYISYLESQPRAIREASNVTLMLLRLFSIHINKKLIFSFRSTKLDTNLCQKSMRPNQNVLALLSKSLAIPNSKATHYWLLSPELSARKAPALCLKQFISLSDDCIFTNFLRHRM